MHAATPTVKRETVDRMPGVESWQCVGARIQQCTEDRMASQMVVPASKDTLFMRGFSARRSVDDIR